MKVTTHKLQKVLSTVSVEGRRDEKMKQLEKERIGAMPRNMSVKLPLREKLRDRE
jgi:hypothetical protein